MRHGWLIFCCALLIALAASCSHDSGMTSEKVDALVAKELPSGASASKIIDFLDGQHIDHSDVEVLPPEILKEPELDTDLSSEKLKGKIGQVRKYIAAKIPNVKSSLVVRWDILIKFYLDKDDKMVVYIVRTVGTGP